MPFNDDMIRRTNLPKDVMGLIHDLCYHHDGRDVNNYVKRAQAILKRPSKPGPRKPAVDRRRIPQFSFYACQFKSIDKLRKFAALVDEMEVEFGIHECEVELANCFVCPCITDEELDQLASEGPMQRIVVNVVKGMRQAIAEWEAERKKR